MVHLGKGYALFGFGFWFKEKDNSVVLRFDSFHSKRPPGYFLPWEVFHFVNILRKLKKEVEICFPILLRIFFDSIVTLHNGLKFQLFFQDPYGRC